MFSVYSKNKGIGALETQRASCTVILKTENVTHGDIELIMIIELNRETKIHTPTFKMAVLTHRDSNYNKKA